MDTELLTGILGGVLCLFGFALYMGGLKVLGMFLGGTVGAVVGLIVAYLTHPPERWVVILIVIGAALVGIALGWRILKTLHGILVFLIGAGLGFLLDRAILAPNYHGVWEQTWMAVASAVVGGVIFLALFRYIIILVTAAFGATLIYHSVGQPWVFFAAFFGGVLFQLGFFYRLRLDKRVRVDWS